MESVGGVAELCIHAVEIAGPNAGGGDVSADVWIVSLEAFGRTHIEWCASLKEKAGVPVGAGALVAAERAMAAYTRVLVLHTC